MYRNLRQRSRVLPPEPLVHGVVGGGDPYPVHSTSPLSDYVSHNSDRKMSTVTLKHQNNLNEIQGFYLVVAVSRERRDPRQRVGGPIGVPVLGDGVGDSPPVPRPKQSRLCRRRTHRGAQGQHSESGRVRSSSM